MTSGDIERVLEWAYSQTNYVKFHNATERALALNHGYTAIPTGCHGSFEGGDTGVTLRRNTSPDAALIIKVVEEHLDPWSAAIVTRSAKKGRRPECFEGVEARQVEVRSYPKRRGKKGKRKKSHKPVVTLRWEPCEPAAICAAREIYARWHAALRRLVGLLEGKLSDWQITGFDAPIAPWAEAQQKAA